MKQETRAGVTDQTSFACDKIRPREHTVRLLHAFVATMERRTTRARMRQLASSVIEEEDLLRLIVRVPAFPFQHRLSSLFSR